MSEAAREWRFYIDDMIGFAERVQRHTTGLQALRQLAAETR